MISFGIILLAAGGSLRLGTPKQLLPYGNKTLIRHALDEALAASPAQVVLVSGAHRSLVPKDDSFHEVYNADWKEGIASSIRCGLKAMLEMEPGLDAVIFIVCDQPYISAGLLHQLVEAHVATGKAIVGSAYADTVGIPALFSRPFFAALQQLKGDEGAKRIIMQNTEEVAVVQFPGGNIDIDTAADYAALQGKDLPPV